MASVLFKNANLLDPLQADLLEGHHVLVEDGLIKEVSDKPLSSASAQVIDAAGRTLMPGLIDLHVHVLATQLNLSTQGVLPDALVMMRAVPIMAAMLRRGFTTVRDAGGAGWGLKCAVNEGTVKGPRLFISGRAISQTGGHGDPRPRSDHLRPMSFCGCCFRAGDIGRVADGIDDVRRAVRQELQMGADQIKMMASGGVASPTDPIASFGYSEEEIRVIVDEAASRQTYVMAHSYTADAIERAIRNGVRTIEHGNLVDERVARFMAEKGAFVVPTLVTYEALANEGADYGLPPDSVAKIATVRTAGLHSLEIYKKAGVKIGYGSDLLGPSQRLQSDEFRIRNEVLSTQEVIQCATTTAAEVLNQVGQLGRIQAGALADVLLVDGNPYRDLSCLLGQGEHLALIMKGGVIEHNALGV
ncbi:amidohydrolase family protein [Achromobacter marplatensis]|jgi:imidazolonepropionase-like amidohydrolase|uniref:Amidohydrolase family protein n=1 Tax=Achromobacter marplatensis TaxID=470868 RepID=J4QL81_9BURK|nr:amidohydrolase family protein [Achromobacter marplatensis]EJO28505.1 amidohydrolase [Achromobacter marplatensis]MDH2053839.1 amidohydrolase family protein [Achromobacter marplatensis]OWT68737.1 amidohydrolase family protein [Achromobacter marplatensis]RBP20805.1 imidazolonepropionase-like amidohydrolase [Achromobacter marplatensis]CAB3678778.1 5'-deoxyadenosine deaminase [Achromobacter marplatensis]